MKSSFACAAIAAGATVLATVPAMAQPVRFDPTLTSPSLLTTVQWRHGGGRRFYGGGNHGFRGGYRHHGFRGSRGAAIGAGVAGLAAGALIGGALASQANPGYGYGYGGGYYGGPGYAVDPGYGYAAPAPAYAAPVQTGDASAYCAQRFKSYDPASGTYLGYDGARHPCP